MGIPVVVVVVAVPGGKQSPIQVLRFRLLFDNNSLVSECVMCKTILHTWK